RAEIEIEELERAAFVKMPHFIRRHLMPATDSVAGEQEVDRGEGSAILAIVERFDDGFRPIQLAIEAAFRMRLQLEKADQLIRTWVHDYEMVCCRRSRAVSGSSSPSVRESMCRRSNSGR